MAQKTSSPIYIKHQHKIMILLGMIIVLFTYNAPSRLGVMFGSLIIGVGIARVRD